MTLLYKTCVNSTVDTAFYYALNNFDLYGFNVQADSVMAADVYFDYTSTPGGKYTTYSDSCIVAATTGGAAARALRTWSAEKIPMGCDQLRIRVSKRAAANGGATKYYRLTIAGIKTH